MPNYREFESKVEHFIEVRSNSLLIPHDSAGISISGLQGLVLERSTSEEYQQYMQQVTKFLNPGRVSNFMKAHLSHRLGWEFTTGWYEPGELIRENGILLTDLGIDMQSTARTGRFRFFSRRYGPEVERAYFLKYGEQIEAYTKAGIPQSVDLTLWAQYLG